MNYKQLMLLLACLFLCNSSRAQADLVYFFDQSNYDVAPDGTVDVQLFITQTGSTDVLTTEGLDSIGGRVFFNDPTVPSDPAVVLAASDIIPNIAFDDDSLEIRDLVPGVSAGIEDSIDFFAGTSGVKGTSILVGTFRFTAGSVLGEVTNLRGTDFDPTPGNDSIVSYDTLTGLDNLLGGDAIATITVSTIPEPSSFLIFLSALSFTCLRRNRNVAVS